MLSTLIATFLLSASPVQSGKALSHSTPADTAGSPSRPGVESAARSASSPDSLVAAIIAALNAEDLRRLGTLSFNKAEFLEVYPFFESDTAAERRSFATGYYLRDNQKILERRMAEEGGRKIVLSRYDIEGPLIPYGPMILYKGFRIWVIENGVEREVKLVKSAAKFHDGWKIWSFRDD